MPPKKRARSAALAATPTPTLDDDAMDVDTPPAESSPAAAEGDNEGAMSAANLWTDDQVASLFKGVIRWKPAGMHKHFRMIAISEHLRNHGFDPDFYQHTRIPFIWKKLQTYYNLNLIDEIESENLGDGEIMDEEEDKYVEFSLPLGEFRESMMRRALASESSRSPTPEAPTSPPKKRKRGASSAPRTRGASLDDTEDAADAHSPAAAAAAGRATRGRGTRGRTRAASHAKVERSEKAETTEEEGGEEEAAEEPKGSSEEEEEDVEEEEDEEEDEEEEKEEEEKEEEEKEEAEEEEEGETEEEDAAAPKPTRSWARGRGRARGGRGRKGRGR